MAGGPVMIWAWPGVWHCVVFGPVLTHFGAAVATGVMVTAAVSPATAKRIGSTRIVGLLGPVELLAVTATTAAAVRTVVTAAEEDPRTVEQPVIEGVLGRRRGGVDLHVAGGLALGGLGAGVFATAA